MTDPKDRMRTWTDRKEYNDKIKECFDKSFHSIGWKTEQKDAIKDWSCKINGHEIIFKDYDLDTFISIIEGRTIAKTIEAVLKIVDEHIKKNERLLEESRNRPSTVFPRRTFIDVFGEDKALQRLEYLDELRKEICKI